MGGLWPDLIIAGLPHAGVPTLHRYLDKHPSIFMGPERRPRFFAEVWDEVEDDPDAFREAEQAFLAGFEEGRDLPVRGHAHPDCIVHQEAPGRIRETIPDARVLFVLRDPAEHAHAWWTTARRRGRELGSFPEFVEDELSDGGPAQGSIVDFGRYGTHLARWLDPFDRERIRVVLFTDLVDDPRPVLAEIARFVEVDPEPFREVDLEDLHNPYGAPRNAAARWLRSNETVSRLARLTLPKDWRIYIGDDLLVERRERPSAGDAAVDELWELYDPEIDRLEELLDRDLGALRRTHPDR